MLVENHVNVTEAGLINTFEIQSVIDDRSFENQIALNPNNMIDTQLYLYRRVFVCEVHIH